MVSIDVDASHVKHGRRAEATVAAEAVASEGEAQVEEAGNWEEAAAVAASTENGAAQSEAEEPQAALAPREETPAVLDQPLHGHALEETQPPSSAASAPPDVAVTLEKDGASLPEQPPAGSDSAAAGAGEEALNSQALDDASMAASPAEGADSEPATPTASDRSAPLSREEIEQQFPIRTPAGAAALAQIRQKQMRRAQLYDYFEHKAEERYNQQQAEQERQTEAKAKPGRFFRKGAASTPHAAKGGAPDAVLPPQQAADTGAQPSSAAAAAHAPSESMTGAAGVHSSDPGVQRATEALVSWLVDQKLTADDGDGQEEVLLPEGLSLQALKERARAASKAAAASATAAHRAAGASALAAEAADKATHAAQSAALAAAR